MFDFKDATVENGNVNNYLAPGIYKVKVSEIKSGLSSQKQSPYIEFTVSDESGATCSQQYYLTTIPGPSGKSAWDISKNAILQIVMAATNSDEATAKAKMPAASNQDELAAKLSTILVGKSFAIHLAGEWVNPQDTSKKSWVKSVFGGYKFAVPSDRISELKHNPEKHIKGTNASAANEEPTQNGVVVEQPSW